LRRNISAHREAQLAPYRFLVWALAARKPRAGTPTKFRTPNDAPQKSKLKDNCATQRHSKKKLGATQYLISVKAFSCNNRENFVIE
jgi:hypothetical protein